MTIDSIVNWPLAAVLVAFIIVAGVFLLPSKWRSEARRADWDAEKLRQEREQWNRLHNGRLINPPGSLGDRLRDDLRKREDDGM